MAYEAGSSSSTLKNGKYYLVQSNGKAPTGLSAGDYVVTGGGTYQIYGFNSDGTYKSKKVSDANTSNYGQYGITLSTLGGTTGSTSGSSTATSKVNTGTVNNGTTGSSSGNITAAQDYAQSASPATSEQRKTATSSATYAGSGSTVTNYGEGSLSYDSSSGRIIRTMPDGRKYYVDPGDEKYDSIYSEYVNTYGAPQSTQQTQDTGELFEELYSQIPQYTEPEETKDMTELVYDLINQLQNNTYQQVDTSSILNNAMTYDEAYELATSILTPQYKTLYDQAATNAAQNLDRAGLVNSLYGQQLQANAQNNVSDQLMAAIPQLALELQGSDREWAQTLLQTLVDENRYAFESSQSQLTATASAALSLIDSLTSQAATKYNYQYTYALQQLQQQAQVLEAQYMAGTLTQQQLDTEMLKLQVEAQQLANQAAKNSNSGTTTTAGDDVNLNLDEEGEAVPQTEASETVDVVIGGTNISKIAQNIQSIYNSGGEDMAARFIEMAAADMDDNQVASLFTELQKRGINIA